MAYGPFAFGSYTFIEAPLLLLLLLVVPLLLELDDVCPDPPLPAPPSALPPTPPVPVDENPVLSPPQPTACARATIPKTMPKFLTTKLPDDATKSSTAPCVPRASTL